MRNKLMVICMMIQCFLLCSCLVEKNMHTKEVKYEELSGVFQRTTQINAFQITETLEITKDNTFSITIRMTRCGGDSIYSDKGTYTVSFDSAKGHPCILMKTREAQSVSEIDRIAHPVDGSLNNIELWSSHYVYLYLHGIDKLFDTYHAIPFVRLY